MCAAGEVVEPGSGVVHRGYDYCEPSVTCPDEGRYNYVVYHPGEGFWLFQYIETSIYVVLAVVLVLIAIRLVRRRIT